MTKISDLPEYFGEEDPGSFVLVGNDSQETSQVLARRLLRPLSSDILSWVFLDTSTTSDPADYAEVIVQEGADLYRVALRDIGGGGEIRESVVFWALMDYAAQLSWSDASEHPTDLQIPIYDTYTGWSVGDEHYTSFDSFMIHGLDLYMDTYLAALPSEPEDPEHSIFDESCAFMAMNSGGLYPMRYNFYGMVFSYFNSIEPDGWGLSLSDKVYLQRYTGGDDPYESELIATTLEDLISFIRNYL